jgi:hypothetical protein
VASAVSGCSAGVGREVPRRNRAAEAGRDLGSDCGAARPDLGEDGCTAAQAADSSHRSPLGRFLDRRNITLQKACRLPNGSERMWRGRADVGYESKACLISPRQVVIDETAVSTNLARAEGVPEGRQGDRHRSAWNIGDDHLRGGLAPQRNDRPDCDRGRQLFQPCAMQAMLQYDRYPLWSRA